MCEFASTQKMGRKMRNELIFMEKNFRTILRQVASLRNARKNKTVKELLFLIFCHQIFKMFNIFFRPADVLFGLCDDFFIRVKNEDKGERSFTIIFVRYFFRCVLPVIRELILFIARKIQPN